MRTFTISYLTVTDSCDNLSEDPALLKCDAMSTGNSKGHFGRSRCLHLYIE